MASTQVRQSKGPGFKYRSGLIAYCHGVKSKGHMHEAPIAKLTVQ